MKKLVLSNVVSGVRKLGGIKQTLEHQQEALIEVIAAILKGLVAGASDPVALHGVVNSGVGSDYDITAGAIYHNDEVFLIDAFSGTAGGGQVPVLSLSTTWRAGDPVKYSDGNTFNTHTIRKYQWAFGASGSGLADFSELLTLADQINNELLDVDGQFAALIAAAPAALDTLNELAAALGDDANFATTVTNALAGKVSKTGDSMSGVLTSSSTGEFQGGVRTKSSGSFFKVEKFDIGAWDMDADATKVVELPGISVTNVLSITAMIREDSALTPSVMPLTIADTTSFVLDGMIGSLSPPGLGDPEVTLYRRAGGVFDDTLFNDTGISRGYVLVFSIA